MSKSILSFFSVVALIVCFSARAASSDSVLSLSLDPEIQRGDLYRPQGLWPLMGASFGAMDHNDQIRTGGTLTHLKVVGTYYFEKAPWVADLGVGLHNEFLSQRGAGSDSIQSLYTELAGRYQLTDRWQLGAIWNTLVDNPDRYRSNTNNFASFIGVQALKEFVWQDAYLVRAGGRVMTDVGISGETIDSVMAELQVSFGKPSTPIVQEEPKSVAPHLAKQAIQTFDFSDPGPVHFETDSAKLVRSSEVYFRRMARALADNRHLFDKVAIIGHADQRGADRYNLKLSQRRAQAVANALMTAGVNGAQIYTEGRGEHELLSRSMMPSALLRNRRVQLEFHGVKNQQALKNIIDSIPQ